MAKKKDTDKLPDDDVIGRFQRGLELAKKIVGFTGSTSAGSFVGLLASSNVEGLQDLKWWMTGGLTLILHLGIYAADILARGARRINSLAVKVEAILERMDRGAEIHEELLEIARQHRRDFLDHLRDHHGMTGNDVDAWEKHRATLAEIEAAEENRRRRNSHGKLPSFKPNTDQAVQPPERFDDGTTDPPTLRPENRRR